MARGGLHPRVAAAEAEADREQRAVRIVGPQHSGGGRDIGSDPVLRGAPHVRPEIELRVALADPGRAAEIVDRDSLNARLGEAHRQLLVEAEQPANIGQHDDRRSAGLLRPSVERSELNPVRRRQCQVLNINRSPGNRRDRRQSLVAVAHRSSSLNVRRIEPATPGTCRSYFVSD